MKLEPTSNSENAQNTDDSSITDCVTHYKTCHTCGTKVHYTSCDGTENHEEILIRMCEDCARSS